MKSRRNRNDFLKIPNVKEHLLAFIRRMREDIKLLWDLDLIE